MKSHIPQIFERINDHEESQPFPKDVVSKSVKYTGKSFREIIKNQVLPKRLPFFVVVF